MATSIASKEELACLPTLEGDSNYPLWSRRMKTFMKNKNLWNVLINNPGPNPAQALKKQLNDVVSLIKSTFTLRRLQESTIRATNHSGQQHRTPDTGPRRLNIKHSIIAKSRHASNINPHWSSTQ